MVGSLVSSWYHLWICQDFLGLLIRLDTVKQSVTYGVTYEWTNIIVKDWKYLAFLHLHDVFSNILYFSFPSNVKRVLKIIIGSEKSHLWLGSNCQHISVTSLWYFAQLNKDIFPVINMQGRGKRATNRYDLFLQNVYIYMC